MSSRACGQASFDGVKGAGPCTEEAHTRFYGNQGSAVFSRMMNIFAVCVAGDGWVREVGLKQSGLKCMLRPSQLDGKQLAYIGTPFAPLKAHRTLASPFTDNRGSHGKFC